MVMGECDLLGMVSPENGRFSPRGIARVQPGFPTRLSCALCWLLFQERPLNHILTLATALNCLRFTFLLFPLRDATGLPHTHGWPPCQQAKLVHRDDDEKKHLGVGGLGAVLRSVVGRVEVLAD